MKQVTSCDSILLFRFVVFVATTYMFCNRDCFVWLAMRIRVSLTYLCNMPHDSFQTCGKSVIFLQHLTFPTIFPSYPRSNEFLSILTHYLESRLPPSQLLQFHGSLSGVFLVDGPLQFFSLTVFLSASQCLLWRSFSGIKCNFPLVLFLILVIARKKDYDASSSFFLLF